MQVAAPAMAGGPARRSASSVSHRLVSPDRRPSVRADVGRVALAAQAGAGEICVLGSSGRESRRCHDGHAQSKRS
jgi:hypothetical protein